MEKTEEPNILAGFQKERGRLRQCIADMESILSENGSTRFLEACRELRDKLEGSTFNLVVMGQFKRGKSTLINALLGETLLPTAVSPLTSVITMLRYGERTEVTAYFLNETRRRLRVEEVPQYITEKHNPKNEKGIDRVEIEYPSDLLRGGVRLIDTPGVGSVFQHNTDIAYRFMPRADAVLFLVTADPPISREELRFLADVREHAAKIFFLKNKIDHLSPEELEESITFTRAALAEHMDLPPERIAIHPISARWALEGRTEADPNLLERSGLAELEGALEQILMTEKGMLILETVRRRIRNLLAEALGLFELELSAIETPVAELSREGRGVRATAACDRTGERGYQAPRHGRYPAHHGGPRRGDEILHRGEPPPPRKPTPAVLRGLLQEGRTGTLQAAGGRNGKRRSRPPSAGSRIGCPPAPTR